MSRMMVLLHTGEGGVDDAIQRADEGESRKTTRRTTN